MRRIPLAKPWCVFTALVVAQWVLAATVFALVKLRVIREM